MATEELYEVEKIVDRRRNKKGKMEYLVRWRGYGHEEDTWEPEGHLSSCMVFIHQFNTSSLLRSTRSSTNTITTIQPYMQEPSSPGSNARKQVVSSRSSAALLPDVHTEHTELRASRSSAALLPDVHTDHTELRASRSSAALLPDVHTDHTELRASRSSAALQHDVHSDQRASRPSADVHTDQRVPLKPPASPRITPADTKTTEMTPGKPQFSTAAPFAASTASPRRSVDLARSGIKILVPKSPMNNSRPDAEGSSPSEAGGQGDHLEPPEVALLEKPPPTTPTPMSPLAPGEKRASPQAMSLGPGEKRARMGIRPRPHSQMSLHTPLQVPITPAAMRTLNDTGTSVLMEAMAANMAANGTGGRSHGAMGGGVAGGPVGGIGGSSSSGKRRLEERSAFDKRLRFSVRQTESAYRYRDIVVKKQDGFTHILLSTKTSENNSLNPEVMKEIQSAMATAASDDSKLVVLGAVGSYFCHGLDFLYFIRRLTDDRKREGLKMAETIRTFVNTFIQFKKPIIAAVNGPAVGLGAAILPLCDVVWANEKAWFQTPYTTYGQTPDACSTFTFPKIMGLASANEMLLSGRKLTAQEACLKGLVSQVLWPATFTQEVMLRIRELCACNSLVLRESKALMRNTSRSALEQANERECEALKRIWGSSQGTDSILKYLQKKIDGF